MDPNTPVLLLDDGELDDVREMLDEVGAEYTHLRGGAIPEGLSPPERLLLATSRRARVAESWPPADATGLPMKIGIVTEDSNTLRSMLRRIGFDLLVRRPVHPEALRLICLRALYAGEERRKDRRVALGSEISYRSGLRRKNAVLVDLSVRGCRMMSREPVSGGSRVTLTLPKELTRGKAIQLRGKVLRCADRPGPEGLFTSALFFEKLSPQMRRDVFSVIKVYERESVTIPKSALPERRRRETPAADAIECEDEESAADRRKHKRAVYLREVVTLGDEARTVLMGRDLSVGGMSIEPTEDLKAGDMVRLAIYGGPREDPFVVRARVVREDDAASYGLAFEDVPPGVASRLEALVAGLPAVESLHGSESDAMGSIVSQILEREGTPGPTEQTA